MTDALHYIAINLAMALTPFTQQSSYLYWPYVLSSMVIALLVWHRLGTHTSKPRAWRDFWRDYFSPQIWWHRSAQADYYLYFVNALVVPAFLALVLVNERQFASWLGASQSITAESSTTLIRVLFTIGFFVAYDFGRFLAHCLLHDVPALWEFHKIHHSAEVLTPMTAFRAHPVELALMAWAPMLATGLVTISFNASIPGAVPVYMFLGWHVFMFAFNLVDNLRHSPVWLSYGPFIGRWLISPAHHQLHHSREPQHIGCNRGFELAIWDRLYGTLYVPSVVPEKFSLGLGDGSESRYHHVGRMYLLPFLAIAERAALLARRLRDRPLPR